jgi:hypothetical protein
MKLKDIFDIIIEEGRAADPRSPQEIQALLKQRQEAFKGLSAEEKILVDKEALSNPYDDSRVVYGDSETTVKTALVGIDVDAGELLVIDRINAKKKEHIDLAIAHHPTGLGFARLHDVMIMQADIFHHFGVPITVADGLVEERVSEVGRRLHAANHYRTADIARLLDIPMLCMHTPADNHAVQFLQNRFDAKKPATLKEAMNLLMEIEEYRIASRQRVPPTILFGHPSSRTGKVMIDMTGGTEGPKDMVDHLVTAGVGTVIGMHLSDEHYKKFQGKHINVIIAGHIASDNLGMNLMCDKLERRAKIKFIPASGFRRVKR